MAEFSDLRRLSEYPLREVRGDPARKVREHFQRAGMVVDIVAPVGEYSFLLLCATIADGGIAYADSEVMNG